MGCRAIDGERLPAVDPVLHALALRHVQRGGVALQDPDDRDRREPELPRPGGLPPVARRHARRARRSRVHSPDEGVHRGAAGSLERGHWRLKRLAAGLRTAGRDRPCDPFLLRRRFAFSENRRVRPAQGTGAPCVPVWLRSAGANLRGALRIRAVITQRSRTACDVSARRHGPRAGPGRPGPWSSSMARGC